MKKAIKRFWGVGLILIILSSLFVASAPVSADVNEWVAQSTPSMIPFYQLYPTSNVADIAVYGSGSTIYMVTGMDNYVYMSTNGGVTWARTSTAAQAITPTMVAVAPDNADRIAITDGTAVYASVNGGATFSDLGTVASTNSSITYTLAAVKDLTISPTRLGANYVTVCGADDAAVLKAAVFYYNLGAVVGQGWTVLKPQNTNIAQAVDAVAYSPNFVSDLTMMTVTDNVTANTVALQVYSFASNSWNPTDYPNYPVSVVTSTITAVTKAELVLDPSFLGGEDTLRNSFIGLDTDSASYQGIYRVLNTTVRNLSGGDIYSIDYDGTTLVAGESDSTSVLRSLDPMSAVPTVTGSASYKSPGGVSTTGANVVVAFVGANVAAGTSGANSAFAISRSSGAYFNDISMIDASISTASDVAVSADGSKAYYVTNSGTSYTSVWLKTTGWERVLSFAYTMPFIIRLSPTNPDVVYLGESGGTRVYFSKDVQSRWYARTCTDTIQDLAVESDAVAYVLDGSGYVVKSSNEGFIWSALPVSTKLTSGYCLTSVQENVLLAGANSGGRVAYSLDGGTTWVSIAAATEVGAGAVIVIPDENYATNNIIYAATTTAGMNIMQWTIGTSSIWTDIYNAPGLVPPTSMVATENVTGLAMKGGILYTLTYQSLGSTNSQNSTLYQYIPSVHGWAGALAAAYVPASGVPEPVHLGIGTASPNALYASSGSNNLWTIRDDDGGAVSPVLYMFSDTLSAAAPAISGPADKTSVTVNPNTGAADVVVLTWSRAANATAHTYQYAYDSAFTQTLNAAGTSVPWPTTNAVISTGLTAGKTYYWRVRASSPINSPWSEVRTFTVQAMAAAVPAIGSPANGATIQNQSPAFSWTPVTGTTKYEFQLSTTPTFGTTVLTDTPASSGTLVPVTIKLEQGKQYFWRVRASEPVQGDWSAVGNFMVAAAPPPPTSAAPPVTITSVPAPVITIPAAPTTVITVPPAEKTEIAPTYIWAIIIIGAILVIAVIVLIVRTRRSV